MPSKRDTKTTDLFDYAHANRRAIVYLVTNTLDGSRYIGITRLGLEARRRAHFNEAKHGRQKHTSRLYRAIRRDGEQAFRFEVLETCETYKEAAAREIQLISELRPEYNLSGGGEGAIGSRPSAESRRKMSAAAKRNPSRFWLGKKRPDIAAQQRARLTGRADLCKHLWSKAQTPEAIAKRVATMKANGPTEKLLAANRRKRKPIICITDGRIFPQGVIEAAEHFGVPKHAVVDVVRGKRAAIQGLVFRRYQPEQ